ncbi:MAG: hypothetical protein JW959_00390 [Pirellulales bacterium]|nr:hypothetical protein [Pirellulales bacterium]
MNRPLEKKPLWPDGKRFAFTVFDETDAGTCANLRDVYALLDDLGMQTTKSCWVKHGDPTKGKYCGETLDDEPYRKWVLELQKKGFEIGWHGVTWHSAGRREIAESLDRFSEVVGHDPMTAANHTGVSESIYWGDARLTGWRRPLYNCLTRFHNRGIFRGHVDGDEFFWGDLCKERIKYFRNFVFKDINSLKACPFMPYHDPLKPYVNYWFGGSDGHDVDAFNRCIREINQDRLEEEGGACIMYTHFASGFFADGGLNPRFRELMIRLSKKGGWFVPVAELLDYLLRSDSDRNLTDDQRRRLERKWLWEKMFTGTT